MFILGHRGDRQRFPDNTIEGIASAFRLGADGVEIDVFYKPSKGVYLVHPYLHDQSKEYPNLEEILEKFGDKGLLQIEIKSLEAESLEEIKKLIDKHKVKNFVLSSSIFPLLRYMRELFSDSKINLLSNRLIEDWWTYDFGNNFLLNYAKLTGADGIDTGNPGFWTKERVKFFHEKGLRVSGFLSTDTKEEYDQTSA